VLATDAVIMTLHNNSLLVRTVPVMHNPHYPTAQACPGGLLHPDETAEEALLRIISTKARIAPEKLHREQLFTFSAIDRDPRGRVVAVAYLCLVPWDTLSHDEQNPQEGAWVPAHQAKGLAYDHDEMLKVARERLAGKISYTTLVQKLMPAEFTFSDLMSAYECILRTNLDKRNFHKKILKLNILKALPGKKSTKSFRPAQLYSFVSKKVQDIGTI